MPKLLWARPAKDADEEAEVRRLGQSQLAPGVWIQRAQMVMLSWQRWRTAVIAHHLHCHPQTVREHLARFNAEGVAGIGNRAGSGRRPRLTEVERSKIISLVATASPGALLRQGDALSVVSGEGKKHASWSLDALAEAAKARGISVKRSQVRRILLKEGVRWRDVHSWAHSADPEFVPKGPGSSRSTPSPR
jgi:transposase